VDAQQADGCIALAVLMEQLARRAKISVSICVA